MTTIHRLTFLAAMLASSLVLPALAKEDKPKRADDHPSRSAQLLPPPLIEQLHLTAAQRAEYDRLQAQWNDARDRHRAQHQEEMKKLRRELRAAREAGDEARVRELREQAAKIHRPQMELRQQLVQQFRATLTPEQQIVLDTARDRFHQRMDDRHDHRERKPDRPG
ncbi:MAG: Spy/CpxP family protein refolding chaperone [Verrucomicrobiae bacterium]|nr:Spy/CpxP family protein refolding chaperone [Verrucomicrobiae bacterium]